MYSNIKFHENPSSGSRALRADRHTHTHTYEEANIRFSQYLERVYKTVS